MSQRCSGKSRNDLMWWACNSMPVAPQRWQVAMSRLMTCLAHFACLFERFEWPPFQRGFFSPLVSRCSTPHSWQQYFCLANDTIARFLGLTIVTPQPRQGFSRGPTTHLGWDSPVEPRFASPLHRIEQYLKVTALAGTMLHSVPHHVHEIFMHCLYYRNGPQIKA